MNAVIDSYLQQVGKLIDSLPVNGELVQRAFLDGDSAQKICDILALKSAQTELDGAYHNALIGFPLPFEAPSFCILEIGCSSSICAFSEYWAQRKFDSYQDYVHGILYCDGKGFNLFGKMTGESLPESPTRETVSRFLIGHVLRTQKESMLFTSVVWVPAMADHGIMVFPPDLLDEKTRTTQQGIRQFVLTHEEIETGAVKRFLSAIAQAAKSQGGFSNIQGKVIFSVQGYDNDPRELWDIPQVKAYFTKLDREAPFFLYYIANESHGPIVRVFLKMFVPSSYFECLDVPEETRDAVFAFLISRLSAVAAYCSKISKTDDVFVDPDETAYHAMRSCGIQVSREDVKKLHG